MSRPVRVLELRSVRGTGGGPEKTILLGTARTDPARYAITVCYIRDQRDDVFGIDARASALPIDYVELRERNSFDPSVWSALRRLVRERGIDIVHAHEYKTDLLAWLLGRFERVIPLATAHGWTGHSPREQRLYYPIDKRLLTRFPKVIAVSSEIRQQLLNRGGQPDRVVTVLNGIDHTRFVRQPERGGDIRRQLGLTADQFVIGSIGRLEPQKRFDLLLSAVASMKTILPSVRLVIVGDGSQRQLLDDEIDRLQLQDHCLMLGHRNDVVELHHAFDLYVQSSDYEGTPNSVLEAMALETPVVATDVGGTAELIRNGADGAIVPPGDANRLAAEIAGLVTDRARLEAYARSARQRVETVLSFNNRMAAVEAVYDELMASERH